MKQKHSHLVNDPRIGKRVVCLSLQSPLTLLGTIESITCYPNGAEYWKVLTDHFTIEEGHSTSFVLYDGPEFQAGDSVLYRLDEGGYWQATVIGPLWAIDALRYLIEVVCGEHAAVRVEKGYRLALPPIRLTRTQQTLPENRKMRDR